MQQHSYDLVLITVHQEYLLGKFERLKALLLIKQV